MSFFEFPHTRTYDSDLGWLIKKMDSLIGQIASLLGWQYKHEQEFAQLKEEVKNIEQSGGGGTGSVFNAFPAFSKVFANTLYLDVCRVENGIFRNEMYETVESAKNIMLQASKRGVPGFCIMIEMCFHDGIYYRPMTDSILDELLTYGESINCPVTFIKIHENTEMDLIQNYYSAWSNGYETNLNAIINVCNNHRPYTQYLTVFNEKPQLYNADAYFNDVIDWLNLVSQNGYITGVTANGSVRSEVIAASTYNFQNVYPTVSYNADLQDDDIYDVMYKNALMILINRNAFNNKPLFISEIGCGPYVEWMANPASYTHKTYWHEDVEQWRAFYWNACKLMENLKIVGFCDFYAHNVLESGRLEDIREFWFKGNATNTIV